VKRPALVVLLLLFGPAIVTSFSPRLGFATAALAVAALVYLVLRNERRQRPPS
jgi:apolipoprotein N-acyltransferase